MKICYLADAGSVHTQRWVKYFADGGHEVHLISYRPSGNDCVRNVTLHLLTIVDSRIRVVSLATSLILNMVHLTKLIGKLKPDILHVHYVATYGFLAALAGCHPLVVSAWGSDVLVEPGRSRVIDLTVRFALARADVILTTSQYLKRYLIAKFNLPESKIIVMPWGVNLDTFSSGYEVEVGKLRTSLGISDSHFVILSPRHLRDHYRIANIVQTVRHVVARYPKTIFILLKGAARDPQFEHHIDQLIRQLGVAHNVRLIRRHLSPQEMAILYNLCDAFISIPKSDQFASSIQEGMACGAVPIVGNLEVYRQYLTDGKNALFVDPDNPQDIAEKVIYCIEHPELKQKFYAINRRVIEENEDWTKNAAKMEELYRSLLSERSNF